MPAMRERFSTDGVVPSSASHCTAALGRTPTARERARLQGENLDLATYRSEFFGRMREILGTRAGVEVVGDRFVFSSEVLFEPGSADLSLEGRLQIAR